MFGSGTYKFEDMVIFITEEILIQTLLYFLQETASKVFEYFLEHHCSQNYNRLVSTAS